MANTSAKRRAEAGVERKQRGALWLSWHVSRRSAALAHWLDLPLYAREYAGGLVRRHLRSAAWTAWLLAIKRPRLVFVQYSYLLLLVVWVYAHVVRRSVAIVCDCHTKALRRGLSGPLAGPFAFFKHRGLARASMLLLTNEGQAADAAQYNCHYFIMADPLPSFAVSPKAELDLEYCVFVLSYDHDEPIDAMVGAAALIADEIPVYFTGTPPSHYLVQLERLHNVITPGFMEEPKYRDLLHGASCVVALTTEEGCLQCAGFEALALAVPFVTSETIALQRYFGPAAIYVEPSARSIYHGVQKALSGRASRHEALLKLRDCRRQEFHRDLASLRRLVAKLGGGNE